MFECSYCEKKDCVYDIAFVNAESYGSSWFNIPCKHCNKMLRVFIKRTTVVESVKRAKEKAEASFSFFQLYK